METLKAIYTKLLKSVLFKRMVKSIIITVLTELSKSTKNSIDDKIVKLIKEALEEL